MARPRNTVDATNEYLGNANPIGIGEIGRGDVDLIDPVVSMDYAKMEAFMHEPVTVVVMGSGDDNDTDLVHMSVNGVSQFFRRDTAQTVKRMYVERLARCKKTDFSQKLDDRLGEAEFNTMGRRHSLRFPFQVLEDKNPKGAAWLKGILAQAQ
jgi:hypothetical protein